MANFVAIDGGGTKTQCWVADESRVLGRARCGTVKLMNVGEEVATHRLKALVQEAAEDAGVALNGDGRRSGVAHTCMGLAGVRSETVRRWADTTLRAVLGGDVLLCGDEEIALDAAFHGGPGVLVIAGTGSNVMGRCSDGRLVHAGGWGPMLGDEGSGHWIGLEAVRVGLRALDRGVETCLLRETVGFWDLGDMEEGLGLLVAKANHRPRPDFAELTAVVASCAEAGDELAIGVLERAGEELAAQVRLVMSKMKTSGCAATDTTRVAFTGSVLGRIARVRRAMEEQLRVAMPEVEVAQEAVEPLEGALWRARQG
jgi:N-acetylglucosamine kinase-like BadF-type ATPase